MSTPHGFLGGLSRPSIYSGACGVAFMCMRLALRGEGGVRTRGALLADALDIVRAAERGFSRRRVATFVEGVAG